MSRLGRVMRHFCFWAALLFCSWSSCFGAPVDTVIAFNTYGEAPFVQVDQAGAMQGLAKVLVDALNRQLGGQIVLRLENVPRHRLLMHELDKAGAFDGVVLFLTPSFVDDEKQARWLWSRPLFVDQQLLIFRRDRKQLPSRLEDLQGLRLGAVLGHRYAGLDAMVATGQITRLNSSSVLVTLRNLFLGRVDFAQVSGLVFRGMMEEHPELAGQLIAIPQPRYTRIGRHILIGHGRPGLAAKIDSAVERLCDDRTWQEVLATYGIESTCRRPSMSAKVSKSAVTRSADCPRGEIAAGICKQ